MDVAKKKRRPMVFAGQTLEVECPVCHGVGYDGKPQSFIRNLLGIKTCSGCRGRGYNLTDSGKTLCNLAMEYMTTSEADIRMKGDQ